MKTVGVATYGTGTVLLPFTLADGSVLDLGTSEWLLPNGQSIYHKGLAPEQPVALPTGLTPLTVLSAPNNTASYPYIQAYGDTQLLQAIKDLDPSAGSNLPLSLSHGERGRTNWLANSCSYQWGLILVSTIGLRIPAINGRGTRRWRERRIRQLFSGIWYESLENPPPAICLPAVMDTKIAMVVGEYRRGTEVPAHDADGPNVRRAFSNGMNPIGIRGRSQNPCERWRRISAGQRAFAERPYEWAGARYRR